MEGLGGDAAKARIDLFKDLGRELKAQEGGALLHTAKLMEPARGKEEQVSLHRHGPLRSQPDGEPALGDPDQLPLLVEVGRAVVHGVEKNADPVDLAVTDDLQFFHAAPPLFFHCSRYEGPGQMLSHAAGEPSTVRMTYSERVPVLKCRAQSEMPEVTTKSVPFLRS